MAKENKAKLFMPLCLRGKGFTLIEMVVVVAIIAILISMVVGIAKRVSDQSKERLCRTTIAIIGNALEQYRDFDFEYKDSRYAPLSFPLDCDGFTVQGTPSNLDQTLQEALYPSNVTVGIDQIDTGPTADHDPCYSGSEVLYFCLRQIPDCRKTLDKIDKSLLTNIGTKGVPIDIIILTSGVQTSKYPFTRIIDPWGTTLRYNYYDKRIIDWRPDLDTKKTFPVITSAGPDKQFGTTDDISNMKPK